MAKSEMYTFPFKPILKAAGPFRFGAMGDEEAIRKAIELASAGEVVAIFPRGRGATKEQQRGAAAHRGRAGRLAGGRPARAGRTRRDGEPDEARLASRRLRGADRPLGSGRRRHPPQLEDVIERLMEAIYELERTL